MSPIADNVTITGTTIAADDIGGVQFQRVKLVWGVDGTANDASASNPIPITVTGTPTVDTELPSAAALADAAANPTIPSVGVFNLVYNGTTWDRVRGDTANGIDVDVTRVQGTVTVDSELPAAAALADATANPTTPSVGVFNEIYNGTTWDRVRSISSAHNTAGTGVAAIAPTGWDNTGSVYRRLRTADADAIPGVDHLATHSTLYNGSTHDRVRGNTDGTLLASSARTTTTSSAFQTNYNGRGGIINVSVTSAGTGSLRIQILWRDPGSNDAILLDSNNLAGTEVSAVGNWRYAVYPGAAKGDTGFKSVAALPLPRSWYVTITPTDASSWTYAVYYSVIL